MNARWVELRAVTALTITILLSACETTAFYRQAVVGHVSLMHARKPIDTIVASPSTAKTLRDQLARIQNILEHARNVLSLDPGKRFTSYADVQREYVVWNLFAAPELATRPHRWCYPIIGCAAYRGYFEENRARVAAARFRSRGFDVNVSGSPAYSSLGWFDDPVISTFVDWDEPAVAGLIFHELAHSRLFIPDDTQFNESFATFVERQGVRGWLAGDAPRLAQYEASWRAADDAHARLLEWRTRFEDLYELPISESAKRQLKGEMLLAMMDCFSTLPNSREVSRLMQLIGDSPNNATFVPASQYFAWIDAFAALFEQSGFDWPQFHRAASDLGDLAEPERTSTLQLLKTNRATDEPPNTASCPVFEHRVVSAAQ